jgi:hypothetical protein
MPEAIPAFQLPEAVRGSLQRLLERSRRARGLYPVQEAEGFLRMACLELGLPYPWHYLSAEQVGRLALVLEDFGREPSRCLHLHALVVQRHGPVPLAPAPASLRRPSMPAENPQPKLA